MATRVGDELSVEVEAQKQRLLLFLKKGTERKPDKVQRRREKKLTLVVEGIREMDHFKETKGGESC